MKKKFAVVIAGCGVYDGAEIHETVLTLLAIDRNECTYTLFAPDIPQAHVVNHLTGEPTGEKRNVLVESARIARGVIFDLSLFDPADYDALLFPGGFGVAKNFCSYAFEGTTCKVEPLIERAIREMHRAGKPIGVMCISPVLLTRVLKHVTTTIGNDSGTAGDLEALGGKHIVTSATEVISDKQNKVFSTPCYMLDSRISEIAAGVENLIRSMLQSM